MRGSSSDRPLRPPAPAVLASSMLLRAVRWIAAPASTTVHTAPRLTFEMMAPVVNGSRLAATVRWLSLRTWHAVEHSRAAKAVDAVFGAWRAADPKTTVGLLAAVAVVASVAHLFMVLAVERYHYPRQTALALPMVIGMAGAMVWRYRAQVARAIEERRHR